MSAEVFKGLLMLGFIMAVAMTIAILAARDKRDGR